MLVGRSALTPVWTHGADGWVNQWVHNRLSGTKAKVMRRKEIFIGSPSESRDLAERIAQELDCKGFIPRRWWHDFPAGSYTVDRLCEIATQVDGAVFLGTGVDVVRSRTSESVAPRDNVIFEYGLFVGALDRNRCLLVVDSDIALPTDCFAITNIQINTDDNSVAEKVANHFREYFSSAPVAVAHGSCIVGDPAIVDFALSRGPYPPTWFQRQLYYGAEGAMNWLNLSDLATYLSKDFHYWERRVVLELARTASPGTLVSLGPGDARVDISIMKMLLSEDRTVRYIPVDISEPLLQRAIGKVSKFAKVPVGIFGDFEDGLAFIYDHVRRNARGPVLYSLLGGTLGNFDDSEEEDFLHQMRSIMGPHDRLLVGASLAGDAWSKDADPKCNVLALDPAFRRFITYSVAKRLEISPSSVLEQFEKCVQVRIRPVSPHDGVVHHFIEYYWKHDGESWPLTRICRYSLEGLHADFRAAGFEVQQPARVWPVDKEEPVGFATLLARPNQK